MARKLMLIVLFCGFCVSLIGCESTAKDIEKADQWTKENLW